MVYDKTCPPFGDIQWHCPFSREWVERMRKAAACCKNLTAEQIRLTLASYSEHYHLPPGDFLSEPQDERGLPLSYWAEERIRHRNYPKCRTAIYDYDSIPEVVVSNGHDDWPLLMSDRVLTA